MAKACTCTGCCGWHLPTAAAVAALLVRPPLQFVLLMLVLVPTLLAVSRRVLLLDYSGGGGGMQSAILLRQERQVSNGISQQCNPAQLQLSAQAINVVLQQQSLKQQQCHIPSG